jgi:O-6-methylguanine DNA methyltransferase
MSSACSIALEIPTPDGVFTATYSDRGLKELAFPGRHAGTGPASDSVSADVRAWHALTAKAVKLALSGKAFTKLPPLDLASGTRFQQQVWAALLAIPTGRTRSYGEIARTLGKPGACRAVGTACGANPIPVLIPCHRVIASGNKLGGFSGGLNWKRLLLAREGTLPMGA